jgi:hypothetical protein
LAPRPRALNRPLLFPAENADPPGIAAGLADGRFDLLDEGGEAHAGASGPAARTTEADVQFVFGVAGHLEKNWSMGAGTLAPVQKRRLCEGK